MWDYNEILPLESNLSVRTELLHVFSLSNGSYTDYLLADRTSVSYFATVLWYGPVTWKKRPSFELFCLGTYIN